MGEETGVWELLLVLLVGPLVMEVDDGGGWVVAVGEVVALPFVLPGPLAEAL